jgi:hypothetical protein
MPRPTVKSGIIAAYGLFRVNAWLDRAEPPPHERSDNFGNRRLYRHDSLS